MLQIRIHDSQNFPLCRFPPVHDRSRKSADTFAPYDVEMRIPFGDFLGQGKPQLAFWNQGWSALTGALAPLSDADLARTVNTATSQDLFLAIEVDGQSPYIARALSEAQGQGILTAAIVGASSLASARAADIVLAAHAHPSLGVGIISIEAIVYAFAQVLRLRYADHFIGTEQAIVELSGRIQMPFD